MSYSLGLGALGAVPVHQIMPGLQTSQLQRALNSLGLRSPEDGVPNPAMADLLKSIAPRFGFPASDVAFYTRPTGERKVIGLRVSDRLKDALLQAIAASAAPPTPSVVTPLPGETPLTITPPAPGDMQPQESGFPWLLVAGGVAVVGVLGVVLYMKKKKAPMAANRRRRRRM